MFNAVHQGQGGRQIKSCHHHVEKCLKCQWCFHAIIMGSVDLVLIYAKHKKNTYALFSKLKLERKKETLKTKKPKRT